MTTTIYQDIELERAAKWIKNKAARKGAKVYSSYAAQDDDAADEAVRHFVPLY